MPKVDAGFVRRTRRFNDAHFALKMEIGKKPYSLDGHDELARTEVTVATGFLCCLDLRRLLLWFVLSSDRPAQNLRCLLVGSRPAFFYDDYMTLKQ